MDTQELEQEFEELGLLLKRSRPDDIKTLQAVYDKLTILRQEVGKTIKDLKLQEWKQFS